MRTTVVQVMKRLASSNFKFGEVTFNGFDGLRETKVQEVIESGPDELSEQIELWADLSVKYQGEPPESYRVLNSMLMDWVDDNETKLKKIINPKLKSHLNEKYDDIDTDDLDEDFDDYIWEDQVDYMPRVNEEEREINFSLELVLDIEEEDEDASSD
ncbi:MAG: hypothetical protein GF334_13245 [Candidatus Altiarchaeales archaeon]|nr:hypothetical protein [Candidatus Altiarchaeales archaeon]